jgi:hypothetical protein
MGLLFADQYSLLHIAVGIIMYFWNFSLFYAFLLHFLFELGENTSIGMKFINKLYYWPGGKPCADSGINILGDNIFFVFGWLLAYGTDYVGKIFGWYPMHITN